MQKHPLTSKVALVTGAARRIGAEIARVLHSEGMNIALHYNSSEVDAVNFCQTLNKIRPQSAVALRAELHDPESGKVLVQQAVKAWGRLDVLINNASRYYRTLMGTVTDFAWEDIMDSNFKAPFFLSQAASQALAATGGCIVNIADIQGERPSHDYSVYCLSKNGLLMMTQVLAKELAPAIRVNAVAPGPIIWPEGENALSDTEKKKVIAQTLLDKSGSPIEVAKAVLFFVRDAEYVTGQVLNVDGGRSLCI